MKIATAVTILALGSTDGSSIGSSNGVGSMEHNVVTLETAKKLQAAGFPQETYFWWQAHNIENLWPREQHVRMGFGYPGTAAPTAEEIADQLNQDIALEYLHKTWAAWTTSPGKGQEAEGPTTAES
jgi:hypothetical protein